MLGEICGYSCMFQPVGLCVVDLAMLIGVPCLVSNALLILKVLNSIKLKVRKLQDLCKYLMLKLTTYNNMYEYVLSLWLRLNEKWWIENQWKSQLNYSTDLQKMYNLECALIKSTLGSLREFLDFLFLYIQYTFILSSSDIISR